MISAQLATELLIESLKKDGCYPRPVPNCWNRRKIHMLDIYAIPHQTTSQHWTDEELRAPPLVNPHSATVAKGFKLCHIHNTCPIFS